jgi:hypothetical protein
MLLNRVQNPCHSTFIGFTNSFVKHPYFFPLTACASIYIVREEDEKEKK